MAKYEYKMVNLKNLYPDPENYRFDPVKDEKEAILNMVNKLWEKIYVLTKSILDNEGLDPSILLNIIKHADYSDKYIVIEGNRRLTALKIIKDTEIIKDSKHYQKFKTLVSKYDTTRIPDEYYCTYYPEKSNAQFWIYLRHSGELEGEGLVKWDTLATQRFKVATGQEKADISYCVNNYLKEKKNTSLPDKTSTTLRRILNSSHGKSYYGLSVENNTLAFDYDEETTLLKLMILVEYLGNGTINSRNANNVTDIQNWIMKLDSLYKATYEPSSESTPKKSDEDFKPVQAATSNNPSHQTNNQLSQVESNNHDDSKQNNQKSNDFSDSTQDIKDSNDNKETKNVKTTNTNKPPQKSKFMDGLIYFHLDQKENKGIYNICDELVKLSTANYKDYSSYPISSGMLLRSLIEQAFRYHLKKKNHWTNLCSKKGKADPTLGNILNYYRNNKTLIEDHTMSRIFDILFKDDSTVKDILDLSIHQPNIVNITKIELDRIAALGIVSFINYLLND